MRLASITVVAVLASCTAFSGVAAAYDFSAELSMQQQGNTMSGKIFISGNKARMEMQKTVIITRGDKKVSWVLLEEQKMYMENQTRPGSVPMEKDPAQIEKTLVGKDTVDGKPAKKYKVTLADAKEKTTVYQWFLDENGFPVKTAAIDGSWSNEFKNIKSGAQPANLFEVPEGFKKLSMPAMPGGAPGAMPPATDRE